MGKNNKKGTCGVFMGQDLDASLVAQSQILDMVKMCYNATQMITTKPLQQKPTIIQYNIWLYLGYNVRF